MLVLGWVAGMCNEHTGPTAMVAMADRRALLPRSVHRDHVRARSLLGRRGIETY